MKKPDSVIFKRHLMKLSLEELTAYLKEYEKVRQVKVLDQINQMKQEEIQTKLEVLAPVGQMTRLSTNCIRTTRRLQRSYMLTDCSITLKQPTVCRSKSSAKSNMSMV